MRRLAAVLIALAAAAAAAAGAADDGRRTPLPVIAKARPGTQCVEPAEVMRRRHMSLLQHQRDATVRGGIRGAKYSLRGCVDCHASPATGSVAAAPSDFCASCHQYAAVRIDCFDCHSARPGKLALKGVGP